MKILLSSFLIAFSPLFIVAQTSKQSGKAVWDKYVVVEGHKMHYQTNGRGTATVVFESGHGDNLNAWNNIFREVATFANVVRYDREGYGLSDTNTQLTSLKLIAERLHKLLQKANIHPPYILTGHSFGGALIRAYAYLYPNEVAGFVFIDPFNEYAGNYLSREQIMEVVTYMDSVTRNSKTTYATEWRVINNEFLNGFPELNSFGALPDVPVVLFAAGKERPPGSQKSITDLFYNKIETLTETRLIVIPQSPHNIQNFEPSLVIENIRRVVFPDAEKILRQTLITKGADSCIAQFKKLKLLYPKEYILERFLNTLGYRELKAGHTQEAIKLLKLNVETYPQSSNVYDSLGEAYMIGGNKKEAIANYEKSLALNPANDNAKKMLKTLK